MNHRSACIRQTRFIVLIASLSVAALSGLGCGDNTTSTDLGGTDLIGSTDAPYDLDQGFDLGNEHDDGVADEGGDELAVDTAETVETSGTISVTPDSVNFGLPPVGMTRQLTFTVRNTGDGNLTVNRILITDQSAISSLGLFSIIENSDFAATLATPADTVIAAGESKIFQVAYLRIDANATILTTDLIIESDSDVNPTLEIHLTSSLLVEPGECSLRLAPSFLNFGAVAAGFDSSKSIRLVNTGTGTCTVTGFKIADCTYDSVTWNCPAQLDGEDSAVFSVTSPDSVVGLQIAAGAMSMLTLKMAGPSGDTTGLYGALISFETANADGVTEVGPVCGGETGTACMPTVDGTTQSGPYPTPSHVNFGIRVAGCEQSKRQVCITNFGAEASLESISHADCSPEFTFENIPGIMPATLAANAETCIDVTWAPTDMGHDTCGVVWTIDGKTYNSYLQTHGVVDGDDIMESFFGVAGQNEYEVEGIPRGEITAEINYVACNDGWTVGGTSDLPTIIAGGTCQPADGDFVEVEYQVGCPE